MKRVKQVRSALRSHSRTTTGRTRGIHGVRHAVSSANSLCMSTHRWTALAGMRPRGMPKAIPAPKLRAASGSRRSGRVARRRLRIVDEDGRQPALGRLNVPALAGRVIPDLIAVDLPDAEIVAARMAEI